MHRIARVLMIFMLLAGMLGAVSRHAHAETSTLTVSLTGTGSGTAAGSPFLYFPASGKVDEPTGTSVTLSALPAANSVLDSWSGCDLVSGALGDMTQQIGGYVVKGNDLHIVARYDDSSTGPFRIYKVDTVSGALKSMVDTDDTSPTLLAVNSSGAPVVMHFNPTLRRYEMGTLNPSTGKFTLIRPLDSGMNYYFGAFPAKGNVSYFAGSSAKGLTMLYGMNIDTGLYTAIPLGGYAYPAGFRTDGKMIGARKHPANPNAEYGIIDAVTGEFSSLGVLGNAINIDGAQLRVKGNVLYAMGYDANFQNALYVVDTVSKSLLSSPAMPGGWNPRITVAGFNSAGNLIGLRWNTTISKEESGVIDPATGDFTVPASSCTVALNSDRTVTATFKPDPNAPYVNTFALATPVRSLTVAVTAFTATDSKGVTGYLITTTATPPSATAAGWRSTPPTSFYAGAAGVKTLYAWAKNVAGLVSAPAAATVNVDLTAPLVTTFTPKTPVATLDVPITLFAASDATGVTGYAITTTGTAPPASSAAWSATPLSSFSLPALTSSGTKTLYSWARDAAGNVSAPKIASVVVDRTAPTIGSFSIRPANNSLTFPILAFTASDNIRVTGYLVTESSDVPTASAAGWQGTAPSTHTSDSPGSKTLYAWTKDAAGNVSQPKLATTVVDLEAPQIVSFTVPSLVKSLRVPVTALTVNNPSDAKGYLVTLTSYRPASTLSTWSATVPAAYLAASSGEKTLYAWVKDAAGNVSESASATVKIDLTPPVVTAFTVPTSAKSLTVPINSLTATDANGVSGYLVSTSSLPPLATAAGWSATPPASYSFTSTGTKTLYAWAKDTAGNVSAARSATTVIPATIVTSISGKVTEGTGVGLANVAVSLYSASGNTLLRSTVTATGGAYSFTGLEGGSYKVFFDGSAKGYERKFFNGVLPDIGSASTVTLSAPTPAAAVHAVLGAAGAITGKVSDEAGTGLGGIAVNVFQPNGAQLWRAAALTGTDGTFSISGLASGSYKVQFDGGAGRGTTYFGGKFDLDASDAAAVTAGSVTAGIDATLPISDTAAISGRVRNGSDLGVSGATAYLYRADTGTFVKSTGTDASGLYSIRGVRSGDYKILFSAGSQGYARSFYGGEQFDLVNAATVTVTAPNDVPGIDGTLGAGGSITGRVTEQGGAGLGGVWVYPQQEGGALIAGAARMTDANGYCTLDGLAAGNYLLQLDGGALYASGTTAPLSVTPGPVPAVFNQVLAPQAALPR